MVSTLTLYPPPGVLEALNALLGAESFAFLGDGSVIAADNSPSNDSTTGKPVEALVRVRGDTSLHARCLRYGVTNGGRGEGMVLWLVFGLTGVLVLGKGFVLALKKLGLEALSGFKLRLATELLQQKQ